MCPSGKFRPHPDGRINFIYILIVPLVGLAGVIMVISGYLLWRKRYKKKSKFVLKG